jgi:hypothetical protein
MKQLIGLIRSGALTAFSGALHSAHRQAQAGGTTRNQHLKLPDRQPGSGCELILLDFDGTILAREVNLA